MFYLTTQCTILWVVFPTQLTAGQSLGCTAQSKFIDNQEYLRLSCHTWRVFSGWSKDCWSNCKSV